MLQLVANDTFKRSSFDSVGVQKVGRYRRTDGSLPYPPLIVSERRRAIPGLALVIFAGIGANMSEGLSRSPVNLMIYLEALSDRNPFRGI